MTTDLGVEKVKEVLAEENFRSAMDGDTAAAKAVIECLGAVVGVLRNIEQREMLAHFSLHA